MAYDSASLALFHLSAATLLPTVLCTFALAVQPLAAQEVQDQSYRVYLTELSDFGKVAPPEVKLVGWSADGPMISRAADGSAPAADVSATWMRLDFPAAAMPKAAANSVDTWQLELTDGSILVGRPMGGNADQLEWAIGEGAELQLILVDLLWVSRLSRRQLPPTAEQENDLLVLATSQGGLDRRRGWLEEISSDGLGFLEGDVVVQHPWSRIQAVQLLEEESEDEDQAGTWLHWRNGSVWAVQPVRLTASSLVVLTPWQSRISIPIQEVAALDRRHGPFLDLADREPTAQSSPHSMVLDWTPKSGRTVDGRRMRLSNMQPVTGWGVKAPTRMEWRSQGAGVFTCWVGVDLEVINHRQRAPLEFRVLLDGVVLATSGPIEVGNTPQPLRAEIPQAGRLELDVRSLGSDQSGGGHGNWVLPHVWRSDG
jgi:hypothetical protein